MKRILLQFDTDPLPSSFDRVVAVDADVEEIFSYAGVTPDNVEPLVHGAMFTRGPKDLHNTAIFIGGSDVAAGEALLTRVRKTFFGPICVSAMMDSNGSNTTAAAAVLRAGQHLELSGCESLVLAGTGPVGQRVAQLLAREGATVRVASRSLERARQTCDTIAKSVPGARLAACETTSEDGVASAMPGTQAVFACGALGVPLLSAAQRALAKALKVAIDVNAVPPVGIEGVEPADKAVERDGVACYGALGVGGLKMKIHKACLQRLFESNDLCLATDAIFNVGRELLA